MVRNLQAYFMIPFFGTMAYPTFISNKNANFTKDLWKEFTTLIGTKVNLMTIFEPQQGEESQVMGKFIKYLRSFLTPHNSDWDKYLIIAEFVLNTHESATGHTPYSLLYNQHAHIPDTIVTPLTDNGVPGDVTVYIGRWETNIDAARKILAHGEPMRT
jgi:hypothetical protein